MSKLKAIKIGVLGLQGAFLEHAECLKSIGVQSSIVRNEMELDACDGLVIPGGESTAMVLIAKARNMVRNVAMNVFACVICSATVGATAPVLQGAPCLGYMRRHDPAGQALKWSEIGKLVCSLISAADQFNRLQGGQETLEAIDIHVHRNYFGRQLHSASLVRPTAECSGM